MLVEKRRQDMAGDLAWQQVGQPIAMTGTLDKDGFPPPPDGDAIRELRHATADETESSTG